MQINRNSWHYKLINAFTLYPPDNLCAYVRAIIWSAVLLTLVGAVIALVVAIVAFIIAGPIYTIWFAVGEMQIQLAWFIGVIYVILLALIIATWHQNGYPNWLPDWATRRIALRAKNQEPIHREPSIFVEYLRAKHEKICPTLEFHE